MRYKLLITIILCFLIIFHTNTFVTGIHLQSANSADLEMIRFESWWSDLNNGTLYIRYLVNNTGETYYSPNDPFYLEIAFLNNTNQTPFSYIKQPSFLDPHSWFTGETIGGCYQIFNISRLKTIIAVVNYNLSIPESNINNNQKNTTVKEGVIIKGQVTHTIKNEIFPSRNVTIQRSNITTLQSNLFIRFSTNSNGNYTVCLYPNNSSQLNNYYTLLFTNAETSQKIIKNVKIYQNQKECIINISFPQQSLNTPNKPIGRIIGLRNIKHHYLAYLFNQNNENLYFKFQLDYQSYSPWINANEKNCIILFNHVWIEPGWHQMKVIIKNDYGLLSSWSEPLKIYIL